MRLRRTAAACLLLSLAPVLLAACGEETNDVDPGEAIPARYEDQFEDGKKASVRLPLGNLLIRVGEPVTSVSREETRELRALDAPEGGSFVPITWQYDSWSAGRFDPYVATDEVPEVDLVSHGQEYRLPSPDREQRHGESFYAVVEGDASDLSMQVTFDGVTQSVDLRSGDRDAGQAAALYEVDDSELEQIPCDAEPWFDDQPDVTAQVACTVIGPAVLPYAGGEWAEPGREWVAVTVETHLRSYAIAIGVGALSGAQYGAAGVVSDIRLDGRRPTHVISGGAGDNGCPDPETAACNYEEHLVFDVPEGELGTLTIEQTFDLRLGVRWGGFDPEERAEVTETVEVPLGSSG